jgi:uncharacterized protein YjiK
LQTPEKQEDSLEVPSEIDSSKPKETNSTDTTTLLKSRSMPKINRSYTFPYDLDKPDFKGNLPKELIEISGLTYNSKNNTLLAINDEAGRLYTLDATDFNLIEKKEFGNNGDYEGIEIVGDIVYVLKANGDITPIDIKKDHQNSAYDC